MRNKDIYTEQAKKVTIEFACKQRLGAEFLLEDAKSKEFKYTLAEIDSYIKELDQWDKRQDILLTLIDYLEIDKKTKKAITKNAGKITKDSD